MTSPLHQALSLARRALLPAALAVLWCACPSQPAPHLDPPTAAARQPRGVVASTPAEPARQRPTSRQLSRGWGRLIFPADGDEVIVDAELAVTPQQRIRGLMHRRRLDPGIGMLFLFPQVEVQTFWMKNTLIPLDMIFLADDGEVVGIVANAEPLTLTQRSCGVPSRYVLEVQGGWAAKVGIREGSVARFEGVPPPPQR